MFSRRGEWILQTWVCKNHGYALSHNSLSLTPTHPHPHPRTLFLENSILLSFKKFVIFLLFGVVSSVSCQLMHHSKSGIVFLCCIWLLLHYMLCLLRLFWDYIHRYSRFQGVGNLTLHFPENFGGDATQIHYIGLKGEATQVISLNFCNSKWFMDDLNDVLSSHWIYSWRGMLLRQLFMKLHQILLTTSKYFLLSRKF